MILSSLLSPAFSGSYWSETTLIANLSVILNIAGALCLGMMVGFERTYRGRAAGVRTYGMVCMASCAIVVLTGHPDAWFGNPGGTVAAVDPTRVIQGITTGVGFLGAGIIHRDGYQTSGLTTAASVWASSAIGIMVGVGLYFAAITLSLLCIVCMAFVKSLAGFLPSHTELFVKLLFRAGIAPNLDTLDRVALRRGYHIESSTLSISFTNGQPEWRFAMVSTGKGALPLSVLAKDLSDYDGLQNFEIAHIRN